MFGKLRAVGLALSFAGLSAVALLPAAAAAADRGVGAVRKQMEASMLVTGKIGIDAQGKVTRYSLDRQDKLPVEVVDLLSRAVPAWRFEPVLADGKAVAAITTMSVRVVATRADADNYRINVRSASFGDSGSKAEEEVQAIRMTSPPYPYEAAQWGVSGTAFLLVKVGRDGKVADVATEQVNLQVVDSESGMERWRRVLAEASMRRARMWTFSPPTKGEAASAPFWVVRVPVHFSLDASRKVARYGKWEAYIPGPRQRNPWGEENEGVAFSPDTLAPGASYLAGSGLKLLTNPAGG